MVEKAAVQHGGFSSAGRLKGHLPGACPEPRFLQTTHKTLSDSLVLGIALRVLHMSVYLSVADPGKAPCAAPPVYKLARPRDSQIVTAPDQICSLHEKNPPLRPTHCSLQRWDWKKRGAALRGYCVDLHRKGFVCKCQSEHVCVCPVAKNERKLEEGFLLKVSAA